MLASNFNFSFLKLSVTSAITLGSILWTSLATPTLAAEKIFFVYSPIKASLRVKSLEEFAQSGTVNKDLKTYFGLIKPNQEEKDKFQKALSTPVEIDFALLSRLLNTEEAERIFNYFGKVINIDGGRNGRYILRGAIVQAAMEPEGLSLINVLKKLPTNVQINIRQALNYSKQVELVVNGSYLFNDEVSKLSQKEASKSEPIDFAQLANLTLPGTTQVEEATWNLTNSDRQRKFYVNVYQPQQIIKYDLNLMSLDSTDALPKEGENLVIVAKIDNVYHVRIFNYNGEQVVDTGNDGFSPDAMLVQKLDAAFSNQPIDNQTKDELVENITSSLGYIQMIGDKTPVVIISHGLSSRPEDFEKYAKHLASYGFMVAVPQHPGSDMKHTLDLTEGYTRQLFLQNEFIDRPQDISYVMDELERRNEEEFQGKLDLENVGIAGHSFGGYTALAVAGATIDFDRLERNCNLDIGNLNTALLLQCRALKLDPQEYNFRDERIKAVFTVNPVNASIFAEKGLSKVKIPTFISAGSYDPATPFIFEQARSYPFFR